MPVHDALPYLDEAIESILGQTYSDFEFVILDDASTDGSANKLAEWALRDRRIRLVHAEHNLGPALSSQRVASEASAPIVARMDADDIAHPERLAEQLRVLRRHPEVGLVASLYEVIDPDGRLLRQAEPWRLVRHSVFAPFAHGTIMYRRALSERIGGYRAACEFWEDHDFVSRMSAIADVMVIPHALYKFRQSLVSTRVASDRDRVERAVDLMYRSLDRFALGSDYEDLLSQENTGKFDPRVFVALGFLVLWAGERPRLFRRLLERGRLSADFNSLSALVWTAWASLNPSTLRAFMRLLRVARNARLSNKLATEEAVRWSPRAKSARAADQPLQGGD
jgi:glycosyltransferase involved in cell wall biosynthesis